MEPTVDPKLKSFLPVDRDSHFPIQNLPYGVFSRRSGGSAAVGVAIGEWILDLSELERAGHLDRPSLGGKRLFNQATLNAFMASGKTAWAETRATISKLLSADEPTLRDNAGLRTRAIVSRKDVVMLLPAHIGDYTDFYSSREHATNVGSMFRGPDKALMPNWLHLPVAYHGRSSSVVVSGTNVRRPKGQTKAEEAPAPSFGPSRRLDFELEMGMFCGPGNELGQPISVEKAPEHIFGFVLVNDWSARDIQQWEYVPLGPFLAKNFATSISPWVVTLDALAPFRTRGPVQEPPPLAYLQARGDWAFDVNLEVYLQSAQMERPNRICATNFKSMYWNVCQQIAHHTVNGCNLRPGDLFGSGTISGQAADSYGSMLELAWRGTKPLTFPNGEKRSFLEDGDRVTITAWCQGDGYRAGFGEVSGTILPATD